MTAGYIKGVHSITACGLVAVGDLIFQIEVDFGLLRCGKDKLFVHILSIGGMVGFDPAQFGVQAGGGAVVGGVIGFAAKKIIKLVAALVGVQLGLLAYLEHQGIVSVDWSQLRSVASVTAPATDGGIPPFVFDALSVLPAGGGFTLGALAGFKKG